VLARVVRNGRVEAVHDGSVAIVDSLGAVLASHGDISNGYFIRSSAKPFQALVSQRFGADVSGEQLALAGSSHSAMPQHIAVIEQMLAEVELSPADLQTPEDWPSNAEARDAYVRAGAKGPRRIWHNCSGKHAAMLRACVASDLPTENYLDPDHPLQQSMAQMLRDVLGEDLGPAGIDGCGAPVIATSTRGLATAYAKFATWDAMEEIYDAYRDHPVLIGDEGKIDGVLNASLGTAAKVGAEACLGVAFRDLGIGVGVKVADGGERARGAAMVGVLDYLGLLTPELEGLLLEPTLGGGAAVGRIEPMLSL
jgi:L-asparaginase II